MYSTWLIRFVKISAEGGSRSHDQGLMSPLLYHWATSAEASMLLWGNYFVNYSFLFVIVQRKCHPMNTQVTLTMNNNTFIHLILDFLIIHIFTAFSTHSFILYKIL